VTDPSEPSAPQPEKGPEALFAEYLARLQRGDEVEFETFCLEHPEQAGDLRNRHHTWQRAGRALMRLEEVASQADGPAARESPSVRGRPSSQKPSPKGEVFWHRYTIKEEIGRGGMGSILEVHDEDFGRELAMKVLRGKGGLFAGMETGPIRKDLRARFFEEARITGRLQHPSIVPVHELGLDPEGKPYFTMKLVAGRTFKEILPLAREGREGWNVQRALGVLLKVCEAVGFAHDKGVIHRDLKPANLMVGSFGEVYVMDWGLARDLNRPEPESRPHDILLDTDTQDFRTRDGDVIGTPEYMSPEQATGKRGEVGPLSDVFAVGAMLYELLCGHAPHGAKGSSSPLVRLAAAIGSHHLPVQKLAPETPGELCAICERALAHNTDDRYQSLVELAEDLRAYQEGRVVQAYASGAWAEARKWIHRNPIAASLAGLVVTLVVVGFVVISGLALRISQQKHDLELRGRELRDANANLQIKTEEATTNLSLALAREKEATHSRALAEQRELEAIAAGEEAQRRTRELETVTNFQASMLRDIDAAVMGSGILDSQRAQVRDSHLIAGSPDEIVARDLRHFDVFTDRINPTDLAVTVLDEVILSKAVVTIGKNFVDQPVVEARLLRTTGEAYHELGLYGPSLPQLQRSLELHRQELGDWHPDTLEGYDLVGTVLASLGRPAEAETYFREALEGACSSFGPGELRTLAYLNNLGMLLKSMNRFDQAEAYYREALRGRRDLLGDLDKETVATIGNLATLLADRGQYAEAEVLQREALAGSRRLLGEDDPDTLSAYNNLGHLLKGMHRFSEAYPYYEAAMLGRRRILGDLHPKTLTSLNNFGLLLKLLRDYEGAEFYYREALEGRRRRLGDDHPDTFVSINNMGSLLKALGRRQEAEPYYREALEGNRATYGENHQKTLVFKNNLGTLLRELDQLEEARALFSEALAGSIAEQGEDHPLTLHFTWNLGALERVLGELDLAESRLRAGLARLRTLPTYSARLEEAFLSDLGKVLVDLRNWEGAEVVLLERHAVSKKKAISDPSETYRVEQSIEKLAELYEAWADAEGGEVHRIQAEAWRSQLKPRQEASSAPEESR